MSDTAAFGDTTAFVTRPESSPSEEREDPSPAESPSAFGTPPETKGEESATSTGPVSAPPFDSSLGSFGAPSDRSVESSFPGSFGASSGAGAESPEGASGDDQESPEDEGRPTTPAGGLSGPSSFTTPLFGERASGGAFPGSPADTDAYKNIGAFSSSESVKPFASPASGSTREPLRGWLEPAVPVPAAQQEPAAPAAPADAGGAARAAGDPVSVRHPTGRDRAGLHGRPLHRLPAGGPGRRGAQAVRAGSDRAPTPPPAAAPAPQPAPAPAPAAPQPVPERASAPSPAPDQTSAVERDAVAEREAYQPPRRPAPPVSAFSSPARTTGRSAGSKPTADSLDPVTLLRGRRNAPATGWRRLVYKASAGLIKPGEAPEVRRRRELVQRARTPVATGHHRVAVLSLKGGVGKTTTTVGLGATLAQVRGDRVIAVDANPDRGTLSDKVELETSATVRDLLNERAQIKRYVDIRAFTSQTPSRLEILASDRDPSVSEAFSAKDYHAVANVLENFYSICITDCGTGLLHSAMSGVLGMADQIVLVSSPSVDAPGRPRPRWTGWRRTTTATSSGPPPWCCAAYGPGRSPRWTSTSWRPTSPPAAAPWSACRTTPTWRRARRSTWTASSRPPGTPTSAWPLRWATASPGRRRWPSPGSRRSRTTCELSRRRDDLFRGRGHAARSERLGCCVALQRGAPGESSPSGRWRRS
ncbi:AAA family ATPase [Microbispora sp. GKU 823]|uniref:AAA family ATPase n=1 Tax=Microbispora sp. GKU 823 TaxID=1652100 RepID=UPI00356B0924